MSLGSLLLHGALAGAAGTAALDATTYADMALRGRPASTTPEQTVERGARLVGVAIPGDAEQRRSRTTGIGAVLGAAAGTAAGVAVAAVRGTTGRPRGRVGTTALTFAVAMLVGNGPMTLLGVTDPRTWRRVDWLADVIPHAAYAVTAAAALEAMEPDVNA
ncbi:MAG: hypothetical protein ACOYX5_07085 [Actinomycetota bacterium]